MGVGSTGPHSDAYRGAKPRFVIDTDRPGEAIVAFGDPTETHTASVVTIENRLLVVEQMEKESWTYMLHPAQGVGIFSRVGEMPIAGIPFGAIYRASCKFSVEKPVPSTFEMQ